MQKEELNIIVCLENIRSVYNVGSIFRTGEGFGIKDFALIGITPTPFDKFGTKRKDFIKTALGAEDRISFEYFENINPLLEKYKNENRKIISIEISENSEDIKNLPKYLNSILNNLSKNFQYDSNISDPNFSFHDSSFEKLNILVFLGSEVDGVSPEILKISDKIYHIPMHGEKESFNVSVAAGILMYLLKQ